MGDAFGDDGLEVLDIANEALSAVSKPGGVPALRFRDTTRYDVAGPPSETLKKIAGLSEV